MNSKIHSNLEHEAFRLSVLLDILEEELKAEDMETALNRADVLVRIAQDAMNDLSIGIPEAVHKGQLGTI